MTATATAPTPLSVWCDAVDTLGLPEGHGSCPGNWEQRLPARPEWGPVQTYRCGCTCHTKE